MTALDRHDDDGSAAVCPNGHPASPSSAFCRECGASLAARSQGGRRPVVIAIAVLACVMVIGGGFALAMKRTSSSASTTGSAPAVRTAPLPILAGSCTDPSGDVAMVEGGDRRTAVLLDITGATVNVAPDSVTVSVTAVDLPSPDNLAPSLALATWEVVVGNRGDDERNETLMFSLYPADSTRPDAPAGYSAQVTHHDPGDPRIEYSGASVAARREGNTLTMTVPAADLPLLSDPAIWTAHSSNVDRRGHGTDACGGSFDQGPQAHSLAPPNQASTTSNVPSSTATSSTSTSTSAQGGAVAPTTFRYDPTTRTCSPARTAAVQGQWESSADSSKVHPDSEGLVGDVAIGLRNAAGGSAASGPPLGVKLSVLDSQGTVVDSATGQVQGNEETKLSYPTAPGNYIFPGTYTTVWTTTTGDFVACGGFVLGGQPPPTTAPTSGLDGVISCNGDTSAACKVNLRTGPTSSSAGQIVPGGTPINVACTTLGEEVPMEWATGTSPFWFKLSDGRYVHSQYVVLSTKIALAKIPGC